MDLVQGYSSDEGEDEARLAKRVKTDHSRPDLRSGGQDNSPGSADADGKGQHTLDRHQGRVRSFPHQEGNYATHVYISVEIPGDIKQALHTVLTALQGQLPSLQPIPSSDALPTKASLGQPKCHISLSRVVPIRYPEIEPLLLSLKEALASTAREELSFGDLEVFENDDKTRTFLSLGIGKGRNKVCNAIKRVNKAFREHGLQQFHSSPSPHASLLWMLGSMREELDATLGKLNGRGQEDASIQEVLGDLKAWTFCMDRISCKIGQRVRTVWSSKQGI